MSLDRLKNGVIVSCQALETEPLHGSGIMAKMALAAQEGGAAGIRANGVEDIKAIKNTVHLPTIGIIKRDYSDSDVYITPTKKEVKELLETDTEIIAVDATNRKRPFDEKLETLLEMIHNNGRIAMADVSTLEEAIRAEKLGFDLVATTMAGYTPYSRQLNEPDFELLAETAAVKIPVIMEGHTSKPEHVTKALQLGAFSVVVGSIITRPQIITRYYVDAAKSTDSSDE